MTNNVTVYNLATGKESLYVNLSPEDALVSAAILEDKRAGDLTNPDVRELYKRKILRDTMGSAAIGNLAVSL